MGYLIILRGPAGSGKETIGKHLVEKFGGDNQACLGSRYNRPSTGTIH
jgi:guanylate kinase